MKKSRLWFNLLLIIVLIASIAFLLLKPGNSTLDSKKTQFAIKDTSVVTKIFMADMGGNHVTLDKTDSGWIVDGKYKINQTRLSLLMEVIGKIQVKNPVPASYAKYIEKDIAASGTKVEIYRKNRRKPFLVYYVGGPTEDQLGTFMVHENNLKEPFVIYIPGFQGYLSGGYYFTNQSEWRTKQIFNYKIDQIKEASVTYFDTLLSGESFILEMIGNNDYKLMANGVAVPKDSINPRKIKIFLTGFEDIQFMEVDRTLKPALKDSILKNLKFGNIRLKVKNGQVTTVSFYFKPTNNQTRAELFPGIDKEWYYITTDDRKGEIMIVSAMTMEAILWKSRYFKTKN